MRALIIGYGSIGQRHLQNLRILRPFAEIVVQRRDASNAVEGAFVVSDIPTALSFRPDFAILATPSAAHIDVLIDLILAGVPTYVEKPVVTSADHVVRVREALKARPHSGHVTGFNLRMLPSLQMAKDLLRSGALGEVVRGSFAAGQWLPDWRRSPDFRASYSARSSDGGGVIFDLSHELDAARFFLGEVCLRHCSISHVPRLGIEAESVATMVGRAEGGCLISVNVDYVARRPVRRYELVGDKASLVWDLAARRLEQHSPTGIDVVTNQPEDFDVSNTYVRALDAFITGIAEQSQMTLQSLEDGLRSTELAIGAHELGMKS